MFVGHVKSFQAAALDGGRFLTPAESLDIFGSEIGVKYYNGIDYVDAVARYQGVDYVFENFWNDDTGYLVSDRALLRYSFQASDINSNPDYITVDLSPRYSIFDTSMIYTSIGVTAPLQNISVYQSPQWEWNIAGARQVFEAGSIAESNGNLSRYRLRSNNSHYVCFVPAYYSSQNTFSAYSLRATFSGAQTFSGSVEVLISVPYVSSDASGSSGVITTSATSSPSQGDINVNVDVDMSETNGLLGSVVDLLSGLVDGIAGLFVPEQNSLEAFENALADLLMDTFGGIDNDMLINVIEDLLTHGATESVTFPALSVPGTSFSLPAYNVPLKPAAAQNRALYEGVALAIDLVATCAVLNLVQTKIKAVLVGEKVVEVEDVD